MSVRLLKSWRRRKRTWIAPSRALGDYALTAEAGSFVLTGQDAGLRHDYVLSAETGSFVLTGQDAGVSRNVPLASEVGTFVLTGQDAGLRHDHVLTAEAGSFVLTGQDATLRPGRTLTAETGSFVLTGKTAFLFYSGNTPFLSGYSKRKEMLIDNSDVDELLIDFPVLVRFVDDADIGANIDSNGYNLRTTAYTGVDEIPYERKNFDNGGSTATFQIYFKCDVSSLTDTSTYIYYRASSPTDGEAATSVWNEDYVAVYHFEEDPSGGSNAIKDSTSNAFHGTSAGSMTSGDLVTGQAGNALDFDGTNDVIDVTGGSALQFASGYTIEIVINPRSFASPMGLFSRGGGDIEISVDSPDLIVLHQLNETTSYKTYPLPTEDANQLLSVIWSGSDWVVYFDSTSQTSTGGSGSSGPSPDSGTLTFGDNSVGNWDGLIDETRISDVARSVAWKTFTYANLFNVGGEVSTGAQQESDPSLTAEAGSFILTGQDAGLVVARRLTAETGSFILTGQDAALVVGHRLTAETGSFVLTGQDAGLLHAYILSAGTGEYILSGQDANLTELGALAAETGSYILTGQDAGLRHDYRLVCEVGSFVLTGQDATLTYGRIWDVYLNIPGHLVGTGRAPVVLSLYRSSSIGFTPSVSNRIATSMSAGQYHDNPPSGGTWYYRAGLEDADGTDVYTSEYSTSAI